MNSEDVKIFLAICRSRSISGAAYALFSTQSTVSRRLAGLEARLGLHLFHRHKGNEHVALTESGKRFLPLAQQFMLLEQQALALQNDCRDRQVTIAAPDSITSYLLKNFIQELAGAEQKWDLCLRIHDSIQICEMVANRTVDIGLTNGEAIFSEVEARPFYTEDFVVLRRGRGPDDPPEVHPRDLDPAHEVFQPCGAEYDRWHDFWWRPGRAKASINLASLTASCLTQAEDWAILPQSVAKALCPPDGYLQHLTEPPPPRRCLFLHHRNCPPEQMAVIREVEELLHAYISRSTSGSKAEKST